MRLSPHRTIRSPLPIRQLAAAAFLAAVTGLAPATLWARHHDTARELNAKIEREHNPVKRAKLEVRLGCVTLDQALQAYNDKKSAQGQTLLAKYLGEMTTAWTTLQKTGRNAARKPSGFMQLEMALVANSRILNDLTEVVDYTQQGPIEKILHSQNALHSKVLLALFPGAVPPAPRSSRKSRASSKSLAGKVHP